jgi:predicted peroxiredoxin
MVRTGDFYVKNQWEHQWLQAGEDLQIINPHFPNVHERMVNAINLGVKVST